MRVLMVVAVLWALWITARVEMTFRAAEDACHAAEVLLEKSVSPDRCASGMFFAGFVDRF